MDFNVKSSNFQGFLLVSYARFRKISYLFFVPELRRSLHIAKYRNEQKSARFHIVTYILKANA